MSDTYALMKSEFMSVFFHFNKRERHSQENLEKEARREVERIKSIFLDPSEARSEAKSKDSDAYFEVNIARNSCADAYLRWAMFNVHWGEHEWTNSSKSAGVWFMLQAMYGLGLWRGVIEGEGRKEYKDYVQNRRKNSGVRGGVTRAGRYRPVKDELIRLLKEKVPEKGWKSKIEAVNVIEDSLWHFIDGKYRKEFERENVRRRKELLRERQPFSMSRENLERMVLDWSRNDEMINSAFIQVIRKK